MNVQEVMALLYMEKRLFPHEKSLSVSPEELAAIAEAQALLLQDIPFEVGKAAVAACAAGSPFAPAISEIRDYARKLTEPPQLSADEAWALARQAITRFGSAPYKNYTTGKYPHEMARDSLPPEVWHVMELMGYQSMCMSENVDVLRGQFIRAWERRQQLRQERAAILPVLPEGVKEKYLAIGDGEEGKG